MNRLTWDWPAVRAAVDARMSELRLSTAELARRTRMSETTIRAFRKGRSRPYCVTVIGLNEGLDCPRDTTSLAVVTANTGIAVPPATSG